MSVLERYLYERGVVLERCLHNDVQKYILLTSFLVFGGVSQGLSTIKRDNFVHLVDGAILRQRMQRHLASCRLVISLHQGGKTFLVRELLDVRRQRTGDEDIRTIQERHAMYFNVFVPDEGTFQSHGQDQRLF